MRRWALPLLLLATALSGVAWPGSAAAQPVAADVRGAQVVVVGAPGLRWSDVTPDTTPALHALAASSAVGVLSVKALPAVSCPADGWLTLGAGARAEAFDVACGELEPADRSALRQRNADTRDAADVDALAGALAQAGACMSARGPGAELAGGTPLPVAQGANQGGSEGRSCPVLLLDAPVVAGDGAARASSALAVDALVATVDAARDPGSTLLVVGLSQAPADTRAHLHVALAAGDGLEPGALRSASTRRAPYVQLVDVAPTVLDLLDLPRSPGMAGEPWRSGGAAPSVEALAELDTRAVAAKAAVVPFFVVLLAALLLALALAAVRRSWRTAEVAGLTAVGALTGSALAGLVPWWRAPAPTLALVGGAAVVGVLLALAARRVPGPVGPAAAVCGVLAVVLVVDLLTGARLQLDTPAGYSPLVAGRFAGIGNVGFGVYAAAVLLSLAAATHGRSVRVALAVTAGGGLVAVAVLGAPPFGSDVGGVLALVPAVVLLALLRTGTRVTVTRLLVAALAGTAMVTAFALADHARPPAERTHLGRFVEQLLDGRAGTVLQRKAEAVVDLLLANVATALLPVVVAAAVAVVVRPPQPLAQAFARAPAWRHGLVAVGLASAVGFAVNDSGAAVPAMALLVAVPATVAVVARRRQQGAEGR